MKKSTLSLVLATCLVAACGGDDDDDETTFDAAPGTDGSVTTTDGGGGGEDTPHHFVTDQIIVPQTTAQATEYGLDIDGDGSTVDNQLGRILATMNTQFGVDTQAQMDATVAAGNLIILHSLRASSLTADDSAAWQVYLGQATATPNFTGTGTFTVDPASSTNTIITGAIANSVFSGGPGELSLSMVLIEGEPAVTLPLTGARLEMNLDATANTCEGKLGGAVTEDDVNNILVPAIADMMNFQIGVDCTGTTASTCTSGSAAAQFLTMFDTNSDGEVSTQELLDNALIGSLLAPDIDLLDGDGNYVPLAQRDGTDDSLSVGVKLSCVGAVFTAPNE